MRATLIAGAALLALTLAAKTAAATTIDFNALTGSNGTPFSSYSEGGYTVAATSGSVVVAQSYANPVPGISFDFGYDPTGSGSVSVTGPASFSFVSADVSSGSSDPTQFSAYSIAGYSGASLVFTQSGTLSGNVGNGFVTVGPARSGLSIDRLVITEGGAGSSLSANLDNIVVQANAVPEPASLALVGPALFATGALARRRRRGGALSA